MTNETAPKRIWATYNDAFGINWQDGQFTTSEQPACGRYTPYVRADISEIRTERVRSELEAAQARIAELEGECSRRAALIPIAYGEGVVDAFARGATVENSSEKFEGSDVRAALVDPEIHRSEWPDNYDNAMARAALEGKG